MSIYNFPGYLAPPRRGLGAELIGFNEKTGQFVQAAAGLGGPDGIGSYADLSTDFYKTFQHDNWQHPGSDGWMSAPVPGWGENPNLQMFPRVGVGALEYNVKTVGLFVGLAAIGYFLITSMMKVPKYG